MSLTLTSLVGTVMIGNKYLPIINTVGLKLIIKTITTTTTSICSILNHISKQETQSIQSYLKGIKELQLEYTINVIEQLVREQEEKYKSDNEINDDKYSAIKVALIGVNEILDVIHSELKPLKNAVDYHKTKLFYTWRSFNCVCSIDTLRKQKEDLLYRYKFLMDLIHREDLLYTQRLLVDLLQKNTISCE